MVELERLGPFGHGNRKPLLAVKGLTLAGPARRVGKTGDHLQLFLKQGATLMKAIAFNYGERAEELKAGYQAVTVEEAERQLAQFEQTWDAAYPVISRSWRQNWSRVVPMFSYPSEIRRVVYTTNTIESLNMTLQKVSKNRSLFPNDEAVFKLMYLALRNISKRWTMPIPNWSAALNQFAILFEGRVPMGGLNQNSFTQTA